MGLAEWLSRLRKRIKGRSEEDTEQIKGQDEQVTALEAEPAPEPVPERRTSDRIIEKMAASQLDTDLRQKADADSQEEVYDEWSDYE